jgi:hypothetical protein
VQLTLRPLLSFAPDVYVCIAHRLLSLSAIKPHIWFFFIVLLFICAYNAWVISPPCPQKATYLWLQQWLLPSECLPNSFHSSSFTLSHHSHPLSAGMGIPSPKCSFNHCSFCLPWNYPRLGNQQLLLVLRQFLLTWTPSIIVLLHSVCQNGSLNM